MWLISLKFLGSLDCFLLGTTSGDAWGLLLRAPQVGVALKDLSQGSRGVWQSSYQKDTGGNSHLLIAPRLFTH